MTRCPLLSVAAAFAVVSSVASSLSAAPPPAPPAPLRMIVVIDPRCPQVVPMLERVGEFRRVRPEIPIRLLMTDPGAFAPAGDDVLSVIQREDLTLEWDPGQLRALGVAVTPTVVVLDSTGRGVRATGIPDLVAVARAAESR